MDIANQNISHESQYSAIAALSYIGPSAREVVPSLIRWVTNADNTVRFYAIQALGAIHDEPDRLVPVLTNALHDQDIDVQRSAVMALRNLGPNAKAAVPALLRSLNGPVVVTDMRASITNALRQIDPETAARAGITNAP
jgi:HEAT repeat protein